MWHEKRNRAKNSKRSVLGVFAAALLVSLAAASCGEPEAPGLGTIQINDGGSAEVEFTQTASGGFCNFNGGSVFLQIVAFKQGENTGDIAFGGLDFNSNFDPPADTQPLANATVVLIGVDSVLLTQHSNNPNADFFIDSSLVVDTQTGFATIKTGSKGVSYVVLTISSLGLIASDEGRELDVTFSPGQGSGTSFRAIFTLNCEAP